jgi:hypothetical protein
MKHELTTVARPLAPEDIAAGMFVAVLHEHESMMPFFLADTVHDVQNVNPVAWRTIPEKARPMKVVSVCVPFVLAERPSGKAVTLDVRQTSLAGRVAWLRGAEPRDVGRPIVVLLRITTAPGCQTSSARRPSSGFARRSPAKRGTGIAPAKAGGDSGGAGSGGATGTE